jgi:tetratricopeptide (TPR) repeat protein
MQAATTTSVGNNDLVIRFNQALALVQQDQLQAAATALEAIGRTETTDSAALALRDQANLVLAYSLLNHSQGAAAIPAFERIRSPGPFANAGLLGLGWALLQPPHREGAAGTSAIPASARYPTIVTPRLTADIVALKQEQAPRVPVANKDQQNALRKALVPWVELTGRDPTDPAVQECMLAIAWAMYHFGAYAQAQDSYTRAADQFNKMRGWYDRAIANIRSGGMVALLASRDSATDTGWSRSNATLPPARAHWWHGDTPEIPKVVADNFYFERLLLDDNFAEALQDYRNLIRIEGALRADSAQLAATDALQSQLSALKPALSATLAAQRTKLEDIATANLLTQKSQMEKYLIEARFALATIYDRPELVSAQ